MSRPRVLIVDDEERFRITLRKLLLLRQIDATEVGSATDAFSELGEGEYDVVLLDVRMPEMNGVEALGKIKKQWPDIEVIILTGHASVDAAVEIMKLGGFEYLLKPCALDELVGKIESAWERRNYKLRKNSSGSSSPDVS